MVSDDSELERIKMKKMADILSQRYLGNKTGSTILDSPIDLTDQNFDQFITNHSLAVVDFWASWCAPCRFMAPIVKELAAELAGRVAFGKLDVDGNPLTASRYGIMSIPTFIIFKNGKPLDMIVGAMPKQRFKSLIERYLS